jgi:phosphoglycerol transferase MdoB-like AlkP superfamily enzyme
MNPALLKVNFKHKWVLYARRTYRLLAPRAYSVLLIFALVVTLAVKLFHAIRCGRLDQYLSWIVVDVSVLLGAEIVLALVCFVWPRKPIIRAAIIIAAVICTWSVMNAAWIIRTGTQILPFVLWSLFRAPLNTLGIVAVNLITMPLAAILLLGPSLLALVFLFLVLVRPVPPNYNRARFVKRIIVSVILVAVAITIQFTATGKGSTEIASAGLRYNCQIRAITSLLWPDHDHLGKDDFANAKRKIPALDEVHVPLKPHHVNHNVVIVFLEGVQYRFTSLASGQNKLTPYLDTLAKQGVSFTNARSTLTHTTKALFALLTGRYPSVSQDIVETVPIAKKYASIATVIENNLHFRTMFFQSAKGNFESRPGLIYNLGFNGFWARDDLKDPNSHLGYLACDEFAMLKPIVRWIEAEDRPFFLGVLCSVTHDPYEVPKWFGERANKPVERYRQAIRYTDKFLAALDVELAKLHLSDSTIFCVIGDHGEAFGEHGQLGHERIAFDEVLHVPWVMRAPLLVERGIEVTEPVSSVDLTPTILHLLGFDTTEAGFDGLNALGPLPNDRKVYFSAGWMQQGPTGFVRDHKKYIYNPADNSVTVYDLRIDPGETLRRELPQQQAHALAQETVAWRRHTLFRIDQERTGEKLLFDRWLCTWTDRVSSVKYTPTTAD